MKKIALAFSVSAMIFLGACAENNEGSKDEGGDQVQDPVLNSGPETEAERSTDAVRDSSAGYSDTAKPDNARPDSLITP